jgi:magnesium-transporting ATPase (P-type)
MSVIVEHPVIDASGRLVFVGQGPIVLYCKGADSAILARTLAPSSPAEGQRNAFSKQQLSLWGNDGLRTLVFGSKTLDRSDFDGWNARYVGASRGYPIIFH